jgi:serine/threonine-protein kinase
VLANAPEGHLLGLTIGRKFVPMEILGEGGMGFIYKSIQKPVGRMVALKVLKDNYMHDEVIRDRFLREAEVIAKLNHRNIVMLFDSGLDENTGVLYMAMEFLSGKSVDKEVSQNISLQRIVSICTGIAAALAEAHKHGIIHRDLKPENVFLVLDEDGKEVSKVLDFGFARLQGATKKLTQAGIAFGTPHYMAPEQAMGLETITSAADVYSLGIMMFELVTGQVPYDGVHAMEIMNKQVNAPIPTPQPRPGLKTPMRMLQLIEACMQKEPEDRPADGATVLAELQRVQEDIENSSAILTAHVPLPQPVPQAAPPVAGGGGLKPQQLVLLIGGAVAFLLLGVIIALLLSRIT